MYYRRALQPGGCYFFTVNIADRDKTLLVSHIGCSVKLLDKLNSVIPFK